MHRYIEEGSLKISLCWRRRPFGAVRVSLTCSTSRKLSHAIRGVHVHGKSLRSRSSRGLCVVMRWVEAVYKLSWTPLHSFYLSLYSTHSSKYLAAIRNSHILCIHKPIFWDRSVTENGFPTSARAPDPPWAPATSRSQGFCPCLSSLSWCYEFWHRLGAIPG